MRIGPKDAAIPTESGQVPSSATVKSKEKKGSVRTFAWAAGADGEVAADQRGQKEGVSVAD